MARQRARNVILGCLCANAVVGWSASVSGQSLEPTAFSRTRAEAPARQALELDLAGRGRRAEAGPVAQGDGRAAGKRPRGTRVGSGRSPACSSPPSGRRSTWATPGSRRSTGSSPESGRRWATSTSTTGTTCWCRSGTRLSANSGRLNSLINSLDRQGNAMERGQRRFDEDVQGLEKSFRNRVEDLRQAVDKLLSKYERLGADDVITRALADLSRSQRTRETFGPSAI